ncbi:MFS transporter [Streptomyces sp. NPDC058847]|uniref:MFS transporter n=2 Tax=unclassified Streptomyces TaxID=2593676 RepID=UPI0036C341B3
MSDAVSPSTALPSTSPPTVQKRHLRRVVLASLIGTTIEYYDFAVYGTAAALVLGPLFFPSESATASTLAAFLTFAAAFLARPLGVMMFGTLGDRVGRKPALVAALLLMGAATVTVGLLPTYETIGVMAPVLLVVCRVLQGVSLGGEWGGAVLLAAEHAPPHKRALFASIPQMGPLLGFLLSSAVLIPLIDIVGMQQFRAWAWRIPFLISAVLVIVGLWVRSRVGESPQFAAAERTAPAARFPLVTLVQRSPRRLMLAIGSAVGGSALYYLTIVYTLSYAPTELGIPQRSVLAAISAGAVVAALVMVPFARWADRVGRRPVMVYGMAGSVVWALPMFGSLSTRNIWLITVAFIIGQVLQIMTFSPMAAFMAELFPARLRYTGASAAFILANTIGGGFAPLVASWLTTLWESPLVLGVYVSMLCLVSLVCVVKLPETRDEEFDVRES